MRFLVTAAGAGPGTAIVKALKKIAGDEAYVVAADMREDAAGLYLADAGELVPAANEEGYLERVMEVARAHRVDLVIPILDVEASIFAKSRSDLEGGGVRVAVNPVRAVEAAIDKGRSFELCESAGIRQPERFCTPRDAPPDAFPLIGRPIRGVGSRGVVVVQSPNDLMSQKTNEPPFVWQRFIDGPEFSIDTWGSANSDRFVAVPRLRSEVRDGQMVKGETVQDAEISGFAERVCQSFGVTDVSCLQVIRGDRDGQLYFVELNPRYGTGVSLSIAAGVPFPQLQWLAAHDPNAITPEMLRFEPGVRMIRYWEEIIR